MEESASSSNKRIAKNTVMLYIRMLLSMFVGLYTSRVVLQTLGVEDYGIYGIVGGVVAMMGFVNASMSGATSRFITFELGRGDSQKLSDTFSSALLVHIIIALIIIVIGETIGLWFVLNKLVIPAERMYSALWVYQLSLASAAIGVTQAPYSACIMSHEKMDIYAYFELLHVFLKLLIVYLLVVASWDKLIIYAVLVFLVSLFMQILYRLYCIRHYKESTFHFLWNSALIKRMIAFTGQTLFAHMSFSFRQQGVNFALNMLFGVAVNAASGIASTINGIISQFSSNILVAFNPQIIKNYANGHITLMNNLIINASKYSTLLLLLFIIPIEFEMPTILELWLGVVPAHTIGFARICLFSLLTSFTNPLYTGLMATGKIRSYSYLQGSLYLITPVLVYYICSFYKLPYVAYYVVLSVQFLVSLSTVLFLKYRVREFPILHFLNTSLVQVVLPAIITALVLWCITIFVEKSFLRMLITSVSSTVVMLLLIFGGMNQETRISIIKKIKKHLHTL